MYPSIYFVLINAFLLTCSAKIENNATNTAHSIEKSANTTAVADVKHAASSNNPNYAPAPSFFPSDFWRSGMGQTLSIGGIVAATLVVLGGVTWLFAPVFGLRTCNLFGNCEKAAVRYNNGGNLQDLNLQNGAVNDAQYIYPEYPNNLHTYYKRSVDYVGPIIKTLASAVEKMEKPNEKN